MYLLDLSQLELFQNVINKLSIFYLSITSCNPRPYILNVDTATPLVYVANISTTYLNIPSCLAYALTQHDVSFQGPLILNK